MRISYRSLKGYKYQLLETYQIQTSIQPVKAIRTQFIVLLPNGLLTVFAGYAWDGPSGPTFDTKNFMRGSLVHDALYQLIRIGLLPKEARRPCDKELCRLCLEDGMSSYRAWWVDKGLLIGGWLGVQPHPEGMDQILTAP